LDWFVLDLGSNSLMPKKNDIKHRHDDYQAKIAKKSYLIKYFTFSYPFHCYHLPRGVLNGSKPIQSLSACIPFLACLGFGGRASIIEQKPRQRSQFFGTDPLGFVLRF
jgi:hypothetical protein